MSQTTRRLRARGLCSKTTKQALINCLYRTLLDRSALKYSSYGLYSRGDVMEPAEINALLLSTKHMMCGKWYFFAILIQLPNLLLTLQRCYSAERREHLTHRSATTSKPLALLIVYVPLASPKRHTLENRTSWGVLWGLGPRCWQWILWVLWVVSIGW